MTLEQATQPALGRDDLQARQALYQFLSLACSDPASARFARLFDAGLREIAAAAADYLSELPAAKPDLPASGEVSADRLNLRLLLTHLEIGQAACQEQYQRIFGLMMSKKCPPYESEYCPQTFSVLRSHQIADVAGFYSAFGLQPSRDMPERHDHIALELEFMAWLIAKELRSDSIEQATICREAQTRFFADHLAWWTPAFAMALRMRADRIDGPAEQAAPPGSLYGAVAQLLAALIGVERGLLNVPPPKRLQAPPGADVEAETGCDECCAAKF